MTAPALSFADWQFSRSIVPWTVVHDFSEFEYRLRLIREAIARRVAAITAGIRAMLDTFVRILTPVVAAAADSFSRFFDAFGPLFAEIELEQGDE